MINQSVTICFISHHHLFSKDPVEQIPKSLKNNLKKSFKIPKKASKTVVSWHHGSIRAPQGSGWPGNAYPPRRAVAVPRQPHGHGHGAWARHGEAMWWR